MPDTTIQALIDTIDILERDLARYRQALQLVEEIQAAGGGAVLRGAKRSIAVTQVARHSPDQQPSKAGSARNRTAVKQRSSRKQGRTPNMSSAAPAPLSQLICGVLASAQTALAPADIVRELARRGNRVDADNVHRRLSDLLKRKTVSRNGGKYSMA